MTGRTRTKILPVSGKEVVIKAPDGEAETLILDNIDEVEKYLPEYYLMCTVSIDGAAPTIEDILDLREPDQETVSMEIGILAVADGKLRLSGPCPKCDEPANYIVDLKNLDYIALPDDLTGPDPTWPVLLPDIGKEAIVGWITGHEERELLRHKDFRMLRREQARIRSIDGQKPTLAEVKKLITPDHLAIRQSFMERRCGYDGRVSFRHKKCKKTVWMNISSDPSFLMPGIPG